MRIPLAMGAAVLASLVLAAAPRAQAQDPNSFNRLYTTPGERNAPPSSDGLHDPTLEGTTLLQAPKEAFVTLPRAVGGNYVNWDVALKSGKIAPRYDKTDSSAKPEIMDLDIVREVKGTMPDVVFPHAAHSEWIECASCHPAPFEPTKGANTMTMAEIMLGQKCGICHGTVAFPVSDCKGCHYKAKNGSEHKSAKVAGARKSKGGMRLPWSERVD